MVVWRFDAGDDDSDKRKDGEADENGEDGSDEDDEMMAMLGFSGFSTTKGKAVDDNLVGPASGAVAKHKARKYRQYMNKKKRPDSAGAGGGGGDGGVAF